MQFVRAGEGGGKGNKCTWNCSLTATPKELARARREQHSAGHKLSPGAPRLTKTDGSRRHVCGLTRPHLPPIYLCLPYRPFTRAFIAARATRREQSTDGAPRPPRPRVREKSSTSPNKSRGDRSENPPPACPAVASYGNLVSYTIADDSWMCFGSSVCKCARFRGSTRLRIPRV